MNADLAKRFHKQSTVEWRLQSMPPEEDWPEEWKRVHFKSYPRFEQIPLLTPLPLQKTLDEVFAARKSRRNFDPLASITFADLSTIIFLSAGIRTPDDNPSVSKRFYPSGGKLFPLEIYINAERVEGLARGIYHYNVRDNTLEKILAEEGGDEFKKNLGYPWSQEASAMILVTGLWERTLDKYKDFGYKLVCLEAGHLMQNIQLSCEALDLASVPITGMWENKINKLLDLDPEIEPVLYMGAIGKIKVSTPEIEPATQNEARA